jgi:hypothetical protein
VWKRVQNGLARQHVFQFVSTLPRGLSGEVLRATELEFPDLKPASESDSDTSLQQRHDSTDRSLRPNPPIRQASFLSNIDQLVSLNIANRARAEQVLELCGNDLQAAVDILLAASSAS